MYLPYIRGKQFELIGLREISAPLLSNNLGKVSPIIEPVKESSTLKTTIREFVRCNINFTIIVNPQVGLFNNPNNIFTIIRESVGAYKNFQIGVIFHNRHAYHPALLDILRNNADLVHGLTLIHNQAHDNISDILIEYEQISNIRFNVVNLKNINRRYFRNFEKNTLVELDDYFNSQTKNSDYLEVGESNFSEEHLYFQEEGFIGFSDFMSIGEDYSESGFLPYAVAIHLSYNDAQNRIKIKHFVSDSNDDTSDIAGKFVEALNKLILWCDENDYDSLAIPIFREFHHNGHFPGLGTLKKLSLINHIDLVLKLF